MNLSRSLLVGASVFLVLLAMSLSAQAQSVTKSCIDSGELSEAQKSVSFLKNYNSQDLCNPSSRTYKLAEAVIFLKNFRWDIEKNKENPLDSQFMPHNFWEFFTAEPQKTIEDTEDTPGNVGVVAASLGALKDGNIYLMKAFYEDSMSTAMRAVVLLHEAQHFHESGHVHCTRAGASSAINCDESLESKGSWAVTMEAMSKLLIAKESSDFLTKDVLLKIKQEMLQMSYFVFNKDTKLNAVYMIDENNNAFIYDGIKTYPTRAVLNSKVLSRYLTLLSFPEDLSNNVTLNVFEPGLQVLPPTGGAAIAYRNLRQLDRKKIVDIFNLEDCTASLYEDYAVFNNWPNVLIKGWTPAKVFCGNELEGLNKTSLYVTDTQGKSHEFYLENNKVVAKKLEIDPFKNIQTIAALKNLKLILSENGRVYKQGSQGAWELYQPLANRRFKTMTRPFLWMPLVFE